MKTVDFETAKTLHDLGYDEIGDYGKLWVERPDREPEMDEYEPDYYPPYPPNIKTYEAPRIDDAVYFLREKYCISVRVSCLLSDCTWFYDILDIEHGVSYDSIVDFHHSYNDALEAGLKKAMGIVANLYPIDNETRKR